MVEPAAQLENGAPEARLAVVRAKRLQVERDLERLSQQATTTLSEIDRLELDIRLAGHKLEEAQIEARRSGAALDATLRQIRTIDAKVAAARPKVARSIVSLNKLGELSYARLLLSLDNPADFLRGYRFVARMAASDRADLAAFRQDMARAQTLREDIKRRTAESLAKRAALEAARRNLTLERARKEERLQNLDEGREAQEEIAAEMRSQETRLMALLGERNTADAATEENKDETGKDRTQEEIAIDPAEFTRARGSLPWPVSGDLIQGFGLQRHPKFDTVTVQPGIEVDGGPETPVRAVAAGRVIFANTFSGYGLLVIVDHGARQYTLYARLGELAVHSGENLQPGAVVGRLPDTRLTERGLHFEVRIQGKAENPLEWLEKR